MQLEWYSGELVAAQNALQAARTTNATLENQVQKLQLQVRRSAELTATNHALREEILEWQICEAAQVETVSLAGCLEESLARSFGRRWFALLRR
jgi:hypothetical protein